MSAAYVEPKLLWKQEGSIYCNETRDAGRDPGAASSSAAKLVRSSRAKTDCTCSRSVLSALMLLLLLSSPGPLPASLQRAVLLFVQVPRIGTGISLLVTTISGLFFFLRWDQSTSAKMMPLVLPDGCSSIFLDIFQHLPQKKDHAT